MFLLSLSPLRACQLGVLLASMGCTLLQFLLPLQLAVALNVVLLSLVFGTIYWHMPRSLYPLLMLAGLFLLNVLSLFGLLQHGLEVYTIAVMGAYAAVYLLPFAVGVFAPLLLFWGLYELQAVASLQQKGSRQMA